jgi:phage terminase large subunit-like protein
VIERHVEEAEAREAILDEYARLCPGIIGNPYLAGHFPLPMQWMFLRGHLDYPPEDKGVFQSLYGGAAGGGKSDALLMAAAQFVDRPEFAGIIFRRTYKDLALPGAIMDRALDWWKHAPGVSWDGSNKIFRFESGAKISFAYMQHGGDETNYQGAEFHLAAWDELTQFPDRRQYRYLLSRIRRPANSTVPLRSLSASNPGGPGHPWVAEDFDVELDGHGFPFYPARVVDNPYIDREAYIAGLMHLHPTTRAQLLAGDWRAREPGDYFRRDWFGPLLDPETDLWKSHECRRVRWWDLAASIKEGSAHTAGVKMARHRAGVYAIEHCASFKATPGTRDSRIVDIAKSDGVTVTVGLEVEPGSGGIAQVEAIAEKLKQHGIRCVYARPKAELEHREKIYMIRAPSSDNGKAARCDPVAACLERGYSRRGEGEEWDSVTQDRVPWWGIDAGKPVIEQGDGIRLFAGPWTQDYLDIVEGFPGDGNNRVDEADATSGAWAWLKSHPAGADTAPTKRGSRVMSGDELRDTNPAERPKVETGRDGGGRWRP